MHRALAIDESWGAGAIHEFFISWEVSQGGADGPRRAREHFQRALALSGGKKLSVFVSYAESVSVAVQDRAEFKQLLERVVAADAESDRKDRLINVLAQRRARLLLAHIDDLFA